MSGLLIGVLLTDVHLECMFAREVLAAHVASTAQTQDLGDLGEDTHFRWGVLVEAEIRPRHRPPLVYGRWLQMPDQVLAPAYP